MVGTYKTSVLVLPHYGCAASPKGSFNPFDTLLRVDVKSGETKTWRSDCGILGEGYFVPSGHDEVSGYLLSMAYRPDGTDMLILDAEELNAGPIARISLPEAFPYGFHGFFQPAAS